MIRGVVTPEGIPTVRLDVGGFEWPGVIDTGFNGDLELPNRMRHLLDLRPGARIRSLLAGGRVVEEQTYVTNFPFDGELVEVTVTFAPCAEILIGNRLLRSHRLEIDFPARTVVLQRP